jgi:hypothetical protein
MNFNFLNILEPITNDLNAIELGSDFAPIPLLFQAGYLTVGEINTGEDIPSYSLRIPNTEVRASLIPILSSLQTVVQPAAAKRYAQSMLKALINLDANGLKISFGNY